MPSLKDSVTFLTSSLGTRWESFSQALLGANFPECRRIVIDGRRSFDTLYFVEEAKRVATDFIALVDEDCFVFDRSQVEACVEALVDDPQTAALGSPDGGTFHRDRNPVACNTFFAIMRTDCVRAAASKPDWRELTFGDVASLCDTAHINRLDRRRMSFERTEPYYPFFWSLLRDGMRIRYFIPTVNADLLASEIRWNGSLDPMLIHMWWLRTWFATDIEPYLKVSNRSRYDRLEREYLGACFDSREKRRALLLENAKRLRRRAASAMREVVGRAVPGNMGT